MKIVKQFTILYMLLLLSSLRLIAQPCEYGSIFWISIKDDYASQDTAKLFFGNHSNATYDFDTIQIRVWEYDYGYCSTLIEKPIPPPSSHFDARWWYIPGRYRTDYLDKYDIRGIPINSSKKDTFVLRFSNAYADSANFTLRWPQATYLSARCDSMFLVDPTNQLPTINMHLQDGIMLNSPQQWNPPIQNLWIIKYGVRLVDFIFIDVGVIDNHNLFPNYILRQNYPNPFNPQTTITYSLPERTYVRLIVYDLLGRIVSTLVDETQEAGEKSIELDARNLTSGVYFYRLKTGKDFETRKMVMAK
jgi:hypothetical protein